MSLRAEIEFLKSRARRPIVLSGMMGSGKSHVGKDLAKVLDIPFIDSDAVIEREAGCSISEIFEQSGEEAFRRMEERAIIRILEKGGAVVVSTGGGAVMSRAVREAIAARSVSIWLRADVKALAKRLKHARNRPLLKRGNVEEILKGLLTARQPYYEQMNLIIDIVEGSVRKTRDLVIKSLYETLKNVSFPA